MSCYTDFEQRIDGKQGNYIVAGSREFEELLDKKPLKIGEITINVGESTNLYNFFDEAIEFVGFYKNNVAVFLLGQNESTLFESGAYYYDCTFIINKERIFKKFNDKSGRDFLLLNGRWK